MRWGHEFNMIGNIACVCKIGCRGVNHKEDLSVIGVGEVLNRLVEVSKSRLGFDLDDIPIASNRFAKLKVVSLCMLPQDTYTQPPSMPKYKVNQRFIVFPMKRSNCTFQLAAQRSTFSSDS